MLATLAAFLVHDGPVLPRNRTARLLVLVVFTGAFATAAIAGLFGPADNEGGTDPMRKRAR
jgi:hypothetical protein